MAALTTPKPDYSTIFDSYTNNDLALSQYNQSPLFNLTLLPSPSPIVSYPYRIKQEDLYPIESSQDRIKQEDPYPNEFPCLARMARSVTQEDSEQTFMSAPDKLTVTGKKIAQQEEKNVTLFAGQVKVKRDPEENDALEDAHQSIFVKAKDVKDIDILSHRGIASTKHPGNVHFRALVSSNKVIYDKKSGSDKVRHALAKKIVDELFPGRFLKLVRENTYRVVAYESAITKALFAMRDCKSGNKRKVKIEPYHLIDEDRSPKRKKTSTGATHRIPKKRVQITKSPVAQRTQRRRKTVTPTKEVQKCLTASEIRNIKYLIEKSTCGKFSSISNPKTRSEEIYASIENMVTKGTEVRAKADNCLVDKEWSHPKMQKCVRMQILQRCGIAMETTGVTHTEFFDSIFRLQLFP